MFHAKYYHTDNRLLAFALMTAGCTLAPQRDEECGDTGGPCTNLYHLGFLRARKIGVGKEIEEAVKEAVDRKAYGILTFVFVRDEMLERSLKAWNDVVSEISKAKASNTEANLPKIDEETVMQVMAIYAKNSEDGMKVLPWINAPMISTLKEASRSIDDKTHTTTMSGAGKVWPLGNQKIKEQFRIK